MSSSTQAVILANISGRSAGFHYDAIASWDNNARFNAVDLVTSVSLKCASIPITYPSIHPNFKNNMLYMRHFIGAVPQTARYIDLYDPESLIIDGPTLATTLQAKLNNSYNVDGLNFAVAYDPVYGRLSITQTNAGFSFSFPIPSFQSTQQERDYFGTTNALGLTCLAVATAATAVFAVTGAGKDTNPVPASVPFFTSIVDLVPTKKIRINISEMPGYATSSTSTSIACFTVPVVVPYGYVNVTTENNTFENIIGTNPECAKFGNTRITLTTPEGYLIPFQASFIDLDLSISTVKYSSDKRHRP